MLRLRMKGGLKPALLLLFASAAIVAGRDSEAPPAIHWRVDATPVVVEVTGASRELLSAAQRAEWSPAKWARLFAVFAEQGSNTQVPAMAGSWGAVKDRLIFEPRFPLARGVRYRAEFHPAGAKPVVSYFELPADTTPATTVVTQIFPNADVLPENQLKFYVQFSAPMSRGSVYEHVTLREDGGGVIELPFLELDEELWDPSMTRLTLLIDPGRIKRGVKPLEDIGPVFEAGKRYALAIAAACRDAAGKPLRAAFEKKFRSGPADRMPPDPLRWKIRAPDAGSRAALVVDFDEPMDQALALRLISVSAREGKQSLQGEATLTQNEQRWSFVPEQPWSRGEHRLTVVTTIEDLAGNNVGKTFDVDLHENAPRRLERPSVSVAFEVK
jgi:hypothetical protein